MRGVKIQDCLICRQSSSGLICSYCQQDLLLFTPPGADKNLMFCPIISKGLKKVDFTQLLAVADYQWPISGLLTGLKFSAKLPHAKALAQLFVEHNLKSGMKLPQVIIPMPLHNNRYLWRKYNQSYEICRHLSLFTTIPCEHKILLRTQATKPQTNLSASQRTINLRKAFSIAPCSLAQLRQYQHIALFDDVITTGATTNAAYLYLKKIHPQLRIDIWSICITLKT
ncbi:ComF family protein [Paraglaciecola sp.]|uniref:ComF family protein n=1 Tax=Paraglaciecola sp. TaxID=1920173 RepID=UPI0030F3A012